MSAIGNGDAKLVEVFADGGIYDWIKIGVVPVVQCVIACVLVWLLFSSLILARRAKTKGDLSMCNTHLNCRLPRDLGVLAFLLGGVRWLMSMKFILLSITLDAARMDLSLLSLLIMQASYPLFWGSLVLLLGFGEYMLIAYLLEGGGTQSGQPRVRP